MRHKLFRWTWVVTLWALFAPAFAAPAPTPVPASTSQIITIDADSSSATRTPHGSQAEVIYSGHVVIHRGALTLFGKRATVTLRKQAIERVVLIGRPARFNYTPADEPPVQGRAHSVTYVANGDLIELDGDVHVQRTRERFTAAHARYDLKTRRLSASGGTGGQIHAVLMPATGTTP